jgi:TonB-linked SusC/RagA family outer membrane protein
MNYIKKSLLAIAFVIIGAIVWAQETPAGSVVVRGVVFDAATKQPIEIAEVTCVGFSSTFTDLEGVFEIEVRSLKDVIRVSSVGYQSKDVVLAGRDTVNVYLHSITYKTFQEEANFSDYSQTMALTPRTIVTANQISDRETAGFTTPEVTLDGRLAGLDLKIRNGLPGSGADFFLRGYSSLYANNAPLVILDGMIYDINSYGTTLVPGYKSNPFAGINVNDIENVTVIKDATGIYGAKSSNGVILINTTHAKKQATSIDLNIYGGYNQRPEGYPLMEATDYKLYLNEMLLSQGLSGSQIADLPFMNTNTSDPNYYKYSNNTDWQKEVFSNSYTSNYDLKIMGGDDVALYALTIAYLNQGGVIDDSDYKRFSIRFNSDIKFSKMFTLNSNISFVNHDRQIGATGYESVDDVLYQARTKAPFLYPYVIKGKGIITPVFEQYDALNVGNPVAVKTNDDLHDMNYRFFGSFNFNVKINPNLSFSNLIGLSFDKDREIVFIPGEGSVPDSMALGVAYRKSENRVLRHTAINNDFRARYAKQFGYQHNLNGVAGIRVNLNSNEEDWAGDYNSANDQLRTMGNGNFLLRQTGGFLGEWNSLTYYASADYDFERKYLLNASISLDGSSRFGKEAEGVKIGGDVYGFFPAIAAGWLVTSEPFMQSVETIDLLKVRASYGLTGNDDIGNYSAQKYYSSQNLLGYQGVVQGNFWNPALKWETNAKLNLGLDVALLKERVSFSVDVFQNKTTDMLDFVEVSEYSGFDGYLTNSGGFTTQGVDVTLSSRIINKPFRWDLGFVLSSFKTKVDAISGNRRETNIFGATMLTQVGEPLSVFYGYKTLGVYSTQAQAEADGNMALLENTSLVPFGAGDVIFQDIDNNGIIDANDRQVIGNPAPDFTGELFTQLKYKGFTLDASLAFSVGGDIYNYARAQMESMSTTANQTKAAMNRWKYEGQVTDMPQLAYGDPVGNSRFSDRWIEDGSFARLRNVTLAYKLPVKLGFLKNAEVYASGINLVTITNYKGLDPEFSINGTTLAQGIDLGLVPQYKSVLLGIKIGL